MTTRSVESGASGARGKISGEGFITSGFQNSLGERALVRGKLKGARLSFSLKAGKQKIAFKGTRDGEDFVGVLKVKVPPEKSVREGFVVRGFVLAR